MCAGFASERVSQEILLIARGESKLISAANNAHPQTVNAWIMSIHNSNAKLLENRRSQGGVACVQHETLVGVKCERSTSAEWLLVPPVRCDGNCMISSVLLSRNVLFSAE